VPSRHGAQISESADPGRSGLPETSSGAPRLDSRRYTDGVGPTELLKNFLFLHLTAREWVPMGDGYGSKHLSDKSFRLTMARAVLVYPRPEIGRHFDNDGSADDVL